MFVKALIIIAIIVTWLIVMNMLVSIASHFETMSKNNDVIKERNMLELSRERTSAYRDDLCSLIDVVSRNSLYRDMISNLHKSKFDKVNVIHTLYTGVNNLIKDDMRKWLDNYTSDPELYIKCIIDRWIDAHEDEFVSKSKIITPEKFTPNVLGRILKDIQIIPLKSDDEDDTENDD